MGYGNKGCFLPPPNEGNSLVSGCYLVWNRLFYVGNCTYIADKGFGFP